MTQKISKLKKVGLAAVVLAMMLPVATTLFSGNAYADASCPENLTELNEALAGTATTITLCGNITGPISISRSVTIDLGGQTISGEGALFSLSGRMTRLTITGTGTVDGSLSGLSFMNATISGGTYTDSGVQYMVSPYSGKAVYQSGEGTWSVETRITANNFAIDAEQTMDGDIYLHKGETAQLTVTLPEDSTSGVVYDYGDGSVITVDENGLITAVDAGYIELTASPAYEPRVSKSIYVIVYEVKPATEGDEGETGAADNLKDLISDALEGDSDELLEELTEAFGGEDDDAETTISTLNDIVYDGGVITTAVSVNPAEDLTDEEKAAMVALMDGVDADNVEFYDVTVDIMDEYDERIGGFHVMREAIRVYLMETSDPEDGYARTYYVVAYHDAETGPELLTEGEDYEIVDGVLYLKSKRFSAFAVGFKDTLIPVSTITPNTGAATSEGGSASASNGLTVAVAALMTAGVLAGVAVAAKRK